MATPLPKEQIQSLVFEIIIKLTVLGVIVYYAFAVLQPFITLVLWGAIIAVALAPLMNKLQKMTTLKRNKVIIIFTTLAIFSLLIPTYMLSESVVSSTQVLVHELKEGTLKISPPDASVAEWPLIGEKIHSLWNEAALNLQQTLHHYKTELKEFAPKIVSFVGGALGAIFGFVGALVIAAIFLVKEESSVAAYNAISYRLVGGKGLELATLSVLTIRSVVQGVIGIALFQGVFSLIGMAVVDMPFAWLWAFGVLFLAIIQVPAILLLGPIIAYVFSYADTTSATLFAIYAVLVAGSDNILKPLLLGRGVDVPMLVILLGAIGGMLLLGILGLFVGAVGLALAYKLFMMWLELENEKVPQ